MRQKDRSVLIDSYHRGQENYKAVAKEIRRITVDDPRFPKDNYYNFYYRIKELDRMIEKIDNYNKEKRTTVKPISPNNFENKIKDLVGVRIISLRLSDVEKVANYLDDLEKDEKIRIVGEPKRLKTFVLPLNPHEKAQPNLDLQYSGYSSVHYLIKLGKSYKSSLPHLFHLTAEIQLRTIFEEAWGELDHKFRYEDRRSGKKVSEHIERGFYSLSAYLQCAAMQAEYLCNDSINKQTKKEVYKKVSKKVQKQEDIQEKDISTEQQKHKPPSVEIGKVKIMIPRKVPSEKLQIIIPGLAKREEAESIKEVLNLKFGFIPAERTQAYVQRRLNDIWIFEEKEQIRDLGDVYLTKEVLREFDKIYYEQMGHQPFKDPSDRDIDLINAVNYALFRHTISESYARNGLISILLERRLKE